MSSSKAPPAPDYVGAAQAQGKANLDSAVATGIINNPNVNSPFGSQRVTWSYDGTGKAYPTITQQFSKPQQALYNQSLLAKQNLANAGTALSKNVATGALDLSGLPARPDSANNIRDDVVNAMMSRYNTQFAAQKDQANSQMIAAGIRPGTAAYQAQMDAIGRQQNDAMNQAILAGGQQAAQDFNMDTTSRQNALAEMLTQRQTPLNEVNALISGSQVNNPFAGGLGYNGAGNVQAAPIANGIANQGQAAMNQYNASQAALNGNISAGAGLLGSLGSAWLSRPPAPTGA